MVCLGGLGMGVVIGGFVWRGRPRIRTRVFLMKIWLRDLNRSGNRVGIIWARSRDIDIGVVHRVRV